MKIFLDANILVAVLNKEVPLFSLASRILSLADSPSFSVYTSPSCLAIAFYFVEKKSGRVLAKKKIKLLVEKIHITPVDKLTVAEALANPKIQDFEDGLQHYAAAGSKCKCIVTEDKEDFYFSDLDVVNCMTFLKKYVV